MYIVKCYTEVSFFHINMYYIHSVHSLLLCNSNKTTWKFLNCMCINLFYFLEYYGVFKTILLIFSNSTIHSTLCQDITRPTKIISDLFDQNQAIFYELSISTDSSYRNLAYKFEDNFKFFVSLYLIFILCPQAVKF